ncbi:class I SAM-dependent methyltransferase [Kaistia granuli]|uniref:class I SAM-dependent methyltransferase n=1 Tax=Kaistia granuli TaxID=363259 RepID=UPI000361C514|nr:class I SAM-dependent methyltransferase [Kaistia granuli]
MELVRTIREMLRPKPPAARSAPQAVMPRPPRPEIPEIQRLKQAHPSLEVVEQRDRVSDRLAILDLIPRGGVGAELGVFTGAFSQALFERARPTKLYLVDVWHLAFGDDYPDWGDYTDHGRLTTAVALLAVQARAARMDGKAAIVVSASLDWLSQLQPATLDWVYIDTTHSYQGTLDELDAVARVLKPGGLILGDDCQIDPNHRHHGVFRAVRDFSRRGAFEIIRMDAARQWAMRLSPEDPALPSPA